MEEYKKCHKCGRELPVSKFYSDAQKRDGKCWWCIDCVASNILFNKSLKKQGRSKTLYKFSSESLIHELRCRGYKGELKVTTTIIL